MAFSKMQVKLFLAILLTVGFFAMVGVLVFIEVPLGNADILKVLVGFVGGAFVTTMSYYFGSSEGQ